MIVWLASYPRSGNTYLRTILNSAYGFKTYSVYGDKRDIAIDQSTRSVVGHEDLPEDFDYATARRTKDLVFIKTHELYEASCADDKVIYIVRDGREATVSYYHYLKDFSAERYSYLEIINGYPFAGPWGEHYFSWQQAERSNMLLLSFERVTASPVAAIGQIGSFLGRTAKRTDLPDFAELNKTNPRFFRSGKTDSFKTELSTYDQLYFWLVNGRAMTEAGYGQECPTLENQMQSGQLIFTHVSLSQKRHEREMRPANDRSSDSRIRLMERQLQEKDEQIQRILCSTTYRLGRAMLFPIRKLLGK